MLSACRTWAMALVLLGTAALVASCDERGGRGAAPDGTPVGTAAAGAERRTDFSEIVRAHEVLVESYGGDVDAALLLAGAWEEAKKYAQQAARTSSPVPPPNLGDATESARQQLRTALVALAASNREIDDRALAAAALSGMAGAVRDPKTYAGYAPLELYDLGLSAMWKPGFGGAIVFEVAPGSAAEGAGFKMGDGVRTDVGFDTVNGLRGGRQPGFAPTFFADRVRYVGTPAYGGNSGAFRGNADPPAYSMRKLEDGSAYVRLYAIPGDRDFEARFEASLKRLAAENPKGWILDLRANAGGSPENMAAVAALFGYKGRVAAVTSPGKGDWSLDAPTLTSVRQGKNLIVLMNYNTLGDAEVLAVALREQNLAWLLGDFTCGWSALTRRHSLGGLLLTVAAGQAGIGPKEVTVGPKGQAPDHWINLDRSPLTQGRDNQLADAQIDVTRLPVRDGFRGPDMTLTFP